MFKYALIALCFAALVLADDTTTEGPCTPGSHKKVDCNECKCGPDGAGWACTKMQCPPADETTAAPACEEGKTWQKECNTCTCSKGQAVCTLKACLAPPSS